MNKIPDMQFEIHAGKLLSILQNMQNIQCWRKHPALLLNASQDYLQIQCKIEDDWVRVTLDHNYSYCPIHHGVVAVGYRILLATLKQISPHESVSVRYEDGLLLIEGHNSQSKTSLPAQIQPYSDPVIPSDQDRTVCVPANYFLQGIQKVAFVFRDLDGKINPQYHQIFIQISHRSILFVAGNGARFVMYRITTPSIDVDTTYTFLLPMFLRTYLARILSSRCLDRVQLFIPKSGPIDLGIKVGDSHVNCSNNLNSYPDVYKSFNSMVFPCEATIDLALWKKVVDSTRASIKESTNKCHYTTMMYDFTKGCVAVSTDDSQKVTMDLALGRNTRFNSGDAPAMLCCSSSHLLNLYKIHHRFGPIVIRFHDLCTIKEEDRPLVAVDFPTIHSPDGATEETHMLFLQHRGIRTG